MGKITATIANMRASFLSMHPLQEDRSRLGSRPLSIGRPPEVIHVPAEDIDLYARLRVSDVRRAEVEAHLANCTICSSKVAAAVEFSGALAQLRREMADMRDGRRIPTDDPATLEVLTAASPDHREVRIRDVSKGGMCIRTAKPIDTGAHVKVQRGTMVSFGEVRYCVPVGEMFHAGILIREVV